jgi:Trk-type K+ transport system membrane component
VPLPGPGWAIVAVGVLIWATEFKWARGVLDRLRFALSTSKKVVTHPRLRLFWNIFSLFLGIAFIVMLTWYLVEFGFSLDGVSAFQGWVIDRTSASRWGSIFGFSGD